MPRMLRIEPAISVLRETGPQCPGMRVKNSIDHGSRGMNCVLASSSCLSECGDTIIPKRRQDGGEMENARSVPLLFRVVLMINQQRGL